MKALILNPMKKYFTPSNIGAFIFGGIAIFAITMLAYHLLAGHFHVHIGI